MNRLTATLKALLLPPKLREALNESFRLGNEGKYEEACALLEDVVPEYPDHWILYSVLWDHAKEADSYGLASGAAEEMIRLEPKNPWSHHAAAFAYEVLGMRFKACIAVAEITDRHPDYFDPDDKLAYMKSRLEWSKEAVEKFGGSSIREALERGALFEEGVMAARSFDYRVANHCFEELLKRAPDCTLAMYQLASCHAQMFQYQPALELLSQCLDIQPDELSIRIGKAILLKHDDQLEAFEALFQSLLDYTLGTVEEAREWISFLFNESDDTVLLEQVQRIPFSQFPDEDNQSVAKSDIFHMAVTAAVALERPEAEIEELAKGITHEWSHFGLAFEVANRIPTTVFGDDEEEEE